MQSHLSAALRLAAFILLTLLVIPPYALTMLLRGPYRHMAQWYWKAVLRVVNIRVEVKGTLADQRPLVLVSNHTSYLDIVILGSVVRGAFVAKSEVASWPGFGTIAKLGRTVFVDRKRTAAARQRDELVRRLVTVREPLIFFPEGTSNDGNRVLPFKSTLFTVAEKPLEGEAVWVQPVSLAYVKLDDMPMRYGWRPFYAWYGGMDLAPHLWQVLGKGRATVTVEFHRPVTAAPFGGRRGLSRWCEDTVRSGVMRALHGRDVPTDPPVPEPAPALTADPQDASLAVPAHAAEKVRDGAV